MLYSKYKVKVARQMKILSALIKYKWLIMGIATFCIVFTSIFLGVQGVITDDGSGMLVTEVTYGESVEYDAKALLSGVAYQYRKIGDTEWTDAKPDKVGEYEVRAVTTRSFGQKNYGRAFRFTINPQKTEVTLASATGVYGDKPSITANLAYSDKIVDFDFRYAEIADRKTTLSIDPASFVVQNAAGEDVSSQYEFSFADTEYALQQRKITFASGSEQFVYDETAHSSDEYEIPSGSLAFDDVAMVSFDKTISSVGKEANSFEVTVMTAAGDDVTDLYAVTKNYGELRVIGKNIIITGETDAEIIYDGKEHTDDGFTLDGNTPIVPSHEIRVKETTFATEAGEYTNEMAFEIVDAEGNDVTDCYDLNVTPGKFTIKPRPINVTTADKEFTYDGTAQFYEGCEADGLAEGHVLSVTSHTEITNVTKGKVANKLTVKVMNGETDVTANYYLPDENYTYGALTMLPRKITVTANGDTFTYDGAAHSSTEFAVAEPDGLVGGHEAAVIADTVKTLTTVGKTDNEFAVAIMANGEPVTDNYEIAYDLGTLEVTKRKVKITTPTEEFVYDGAKHSSTDHANFVIGEGEDCYPLVDGHTIAPADISAVPTITNVFDGENGVANEFVIKIVDADGNDVTENYDTEDISFGTLKVTPRPVTVKADDDEKTYDGTPLENAGCMPGDSTADSGLVDGHELIAKAEGTITNAGTAENVVNEPAQIFAANGDDVTRNYDIKYDKGTLTVTPRDIIVTTDDGTFVYDGDEHYQPSCSADALVDALGHQLVATNYTTVMNVKDSGKANVLEVKVVDANGNDTVDGYYLSDNYNIIEWKNGTLTVLARTVRVTTGSDFKDYDGTPLTKHTFETQKGVEDEGLVEKHLHTMTLEFTGAITNVKFNEDGSIGTEENTVDRELTQIFDGSGESVIANYKIEYTLGTLEIDQRKIKIATPTEEFIYDGEPHSSVTNFDISVPEGYYDLVYGHTIAPDDISAVPTITNVFDGVVRNAFAVQIYDENGEPVTKNYAIELSDGELTVTPRIVRVNVLGGKKVYDGTPLTKHEINVEQGIANEGLVSDHYISPRFTGSQTDAGQSVNTIDEENTKVLTLAGSIKDVTANYDVKYNYDEALLVVEQRPITITVNSDEKDYDGDPLTNNGYTVSEYTTESGLIPGQILTAEVEGSQTVKGTSANVIMGVKITVKDENGNEKDVTANYEITSINGVLTVNPRAIKVRTRGDEFTYDGLDHAYNNDSDYEIVEGSLVKDHRFMLTEYTTVKNANGDGVKNVITLMVVRGEAGATEDMSENYAVTYDCGILKVNRRPIDITTASATFEYNGTAHTTEYSKNEITQDNLVTGHRIQVDSRTEITYVQQSGTLNKLVVSIWDGEGENATDNYDIHYDEGTLTVTPKAITVTTESHEFTYNGTDQFWEKCYTDGLASADQSLEVIEHTTIRNVDDKSRENALVVIVTANGKDNVDGYYLTANYTISYSNGTLTVIPRPITIKTGDATKVYDGAPLTCNSYKDVAEDGDRGLVDGHKVTYVAVNGTRTEAGVSDNTVDLEKQPIIVDENGKPVTENYAIDYVDGTLTVTALELWVITPSVSVMYDGNDHYAIDDIKVDESKGGKLVDGHKIIAADDNYPCITDVGNKPNEFAVKVVDENGDGGVNGNYVIKGYTYGTLEVTPRPITVIITGATLVYDGTEQGSDAFTVEDEPYGLVSGHIATAKADTVPTKKNVGVIEGYEFKVEITAGGQNVTGNYEITYTPGTLEITKRKVKITTPTEEFLYDGTAHAAIDPEKFEIDATDGYFSLVGGHTVKPSGKYPTRTKAGREKNVFAIMICDEYGNDVSGNYEYEADLSYGMLIVHKRAITVKTPTARLVYNGQYQHATDGCETSASSLNELVEGHVIKVDGKFPSLIDVGTTQNKFAVGIFDGINDVTDNYVIDYEYGTLEIFPRPITIKTGDATKVYDGAPLTCNSYKDVAEDGDRGLVDGHKVTYVAVNGTRTEAGVSDNTVDLEKQPIIVDENGKEVTKNYEVSYAYGKLTVTKRPIKITTVSATKVYDGTPLDPTLYESYTVTSTANPALSPILAPDQSAEVDFLNTVTDVGSVKNEVAVRIYADADTEKATDLSANYEISYEYGTLSITPIQVRYTSESATKDFDGTPLTASFDYDTTAFLAGHTPTVTFTSITFKGTINNELKSLEVVDAAGNVVPSNNYEFVPITGKVGTLTIVPIRITVQTGDAEKYYDGDPLSAEEYQVTSGNVLSGHEVLQPEFPSFTDVGRYANKIKLEIVDKTSKENMSDGYEITYEYGEIVIKARIIKIVSGGKTKVYDGKPLTCDAYYITGLEGIDEIPDEIELAVKNIGSQTEIGSSKNYVGESKVVFAGTDEVAPGYSIVVEDMGILTVKEKSDKDKTTGGGLDDSGDVSIRGDRGDGGGNGGSDVIAFVVNGDTSGQLYLRYKSFGSYHGTGWNAATEYGGTLDGGFSYNYLTGQTLEKYGTNQCNVTITAYAGFMLPYYFVGGDGFTKQTSDVSFVGDYSAAYSVPYYVFDFSPSHSLINGSYAADDDAYYEFVRANYLDVPETTKEYLQGIALTENWVEGEITYDDIVAIAQYIRKSAKYNIEYNTRLDYEKDVVVSFLDKYKEGVCRHYASAATLLYRTLGIPARYTIGYAGSTVAGEDVEITGKQAHAWVEIYIKGLGWVDMEVTAGGVGGGGGNGGDDSDDGPIDFGDGSMGFEVKPIDVKKVYDKTPLYAKSEVEMNEKLRSLSDNGYYWDVTVAGWRTEYGIGESTVTEFVLYNKKGETLYEYRDGTVIENSKGFTVTFKSGKIRVMHKPIPIYLYEKDKPYDGTPLGYEPDDYYYRTSELPEGCSRIILELKGEITDVGVFDTDLLLDLDFKALDANDNDITATIKENYELDFIGTGLTVTKREITVSSGTKQKKYDGKALVCEDAWVSFGSLADGDKIVVAKATSVIDVGEEENEIVVEIMRNGVDVTSNYKINYVYGTLTIYD